MIFEYEKMYLGAQFSQCIILKPSWNNFTITHFFRAIFSDYIRTLHKSREYWKNWKKSMVTNCKVASPGVSTSWFFICIVLSCISCVFFWMIRLSFFFWPIFPFVDRLNLSLFYYTPFYTCIRNVDILQTRTC